jgi:hypothetical protein
MLDVCFYSRGEGDLCLWKIAGGKVSPSRHDRATFLSSFTVITSRMVEFGLKLEDNKVDEW